MINVIYKKRGLNINTVWFCNDIKNVISNSKADFVFFHGISDNNYKNAIINKQYSLMTDLSIPLDRIFEQIGKNYRYEINRAKKENIECVYFNSADLKNDFSILSSFKKEYQEFVNLKGIVNTYNDLAMEKYIESGSVILTKAFKGAEDYAQHVYLCDNNTTRLLYSVSNFRAEGADSNLIGRANKYLHWCDIEYFCNHKVNIYDWGGISSSDNPNGVDKFKKEFGGYEHIYYNAIIGKSLAGKIAVLLMKMKRRFS